MDERPIDRLIAIMARLRDPERLESRRLDPRESDLR
jgi:hypothetical protein